MRLLKPLKKKNRKKLHQLHICYFLKSLSYSYTLKVNTFYLMH